jgi:hypothetical protein
LQNESEIRPNSVLEIAGAITVFAKSLCDDRELLQDSLRIARDAIIADHYHERFLRSSVHLSGA